MSELEPISQNVSNSRRLFDLIFGRLLSQERKNSFVPYRFLYPGLKLNEDLHYIAYKFYLLVTFITYALFVCMLVDLSLKTGLIVNYQIFESDNLYFLKRVDEFISPIILSISIVMYFIMKSTIQLKTQHLPILIRKRVLQPPKKTKWLMAEGLMLFIALICFFLLHIAASRIVFHFKMQDSFPFILFIEIVGISTFGYAAALLVFTLLAIEKTIRFFSEIQSDLSIMGPGFWDRQN